MTETGDSVSAVLAEASRQARAGLKSENLDKLAAAATKVEALGKNLGVAVQKTLIPHLDASLLSLATGALSLHDGEVPVRRAGLGTRRLLAMAMQREATAEGGITIIDEFEQGLEPHRIRRLLRVLRGRAPEEPITVSGQLIFTTHSPTVLSELDGAEVATVRRAPDGSVQVQALPKAIERVLKRAPHALLARKVVVAEGDTEEGLCIGLDRAWTTKMGASFAYRGVAVVNGEGGTQPAELAGHLVTLGYEVALLIDSDAKAKASRALGATVLAWPDGLCTEQRLATDLPDAAIAKMATEAHRIGGRGVRDALAAELNIPRAMLKEGEPESWVSAAGTQAFRKAFGDVAKKKNQAWFKSRTQGAFLATLVSEYWDAAAATPTVLMLNDLRSFVHG